MHVAYIGFFHGYGLVGTMEETLGSIDVLKLVFDSCNSFSALLCMPSVHVTPAHKIQVSYLQYGENHFLL